MFKNITLGKFSYDKGGQIYLAPGDNMQYGLESSSCMHELFHAHVCLSKGYFKNCVRNVDFTGVSAIAYAPFSVVLSVDASDLEAFSFAIRSFSALRRL